MLKNQHFGFNLHKYYMIFQVHRVLWETDRHSENIQDHAKDIPPSNYIDENVKTQEEWKHKELQKTQELSPEGYLKQLIEHRSISYLFCITQLCLTI